MNKLTEQIQAEVNKVVLGKEDIVRKVLLAILAQGHVLLEDVPGVGKTTLAKAFSKTLGLDSRRVQFTSDTLPSDIIGFSVFDKADGKLKYQPGAIMTNLLLADEINRTSSKTQSALLEAMEELQVTVDGVTRPLPKPFVVLATENPVGSAGTQMLPASQLDRFLIRLSMGYPNRASTAALLKDRHHVDPLSACQTVTTPDELEKLIADVADIHVADRIYDYIAELVDVTRSNAYVTLGVSPRGALAVTRAAKANAYLEGRNYVIPEAFPSVSYPWWGMAAAALLVQAVLFAAAHGSAEAKIYAFAMGLVFGWAVEHTGRLWPGMGLHCLNNCIVLAGCLAERGLG